MTNQGKMIPLVRHTLSSVEGLGMTGKKLILWKQRNPKICFMEYRQPSSAGVLEKENTAGLREVNEAIYIKAYGSPLNRDGGK